MSSDSGTDPTSDQIKSALDNAEALLFDLDGTLIDSSGSTRRAWSAFAIRNGLDPEEVVAEVQGQPSAESSARLARPGADPEEEARFVEDRELADSEGIVPHPGAIAALSSGKKVAIVTSCTDALATVRINAAGLPSPDVVVTANDIENGKPHPEPFLLGARKLGVSPQDCVVFEDAPAGVESGKAAGAFVIALRTTHPEETLAVADLIVDNLADVFGDAQA